jgi:hypothetical protein
MHIAQQIVWRKKLEEGYHENPNHTYFKDKYSRTFPLDVYIFAYDKVCM